MMAEPAAGPVAGYRTERHGREYAAQRRTDPRLAARVHAAFGTARSVLNVGAGAGSYEPADRYVAAVEPSAWMRAARPPHLPPAMDAFAENLPFDDDSFDAGLAAATVHQWSDPARGLAELRRVVRGPVVILTFDPDALDRLWLVRYVPELLEVEARRMPPISTIAEHLGGSVEVQALPVPRDCVDGFAEAYYARPERFLDADVRLAQSFWDFVDPEAAQRGLASLSAELDSGAWDQRFGQLRGQPEFHGSLRLVVSRPG